MRLLLRSFSSLDPFHRVMRRGRFLRALRNLAVALALPLAVFSAASAQQMPPGAKQPTDFPRAKLTAGMYVIDAAVAASDADREQGLMYRTQLAPNEGMLFVFNENAVHCFWMKNTLIPLSIAFIRADGTITDIDEMQAETTNNHCPRNNGVYALEMSKGWFDAKGIKPGMKIQGLPAPR
ncbi:exported protein [Caballeronia glathei]|uniref:Uncharacterized protein n=2 Tax=Caballeronia glathei TaxID=60547 RepID=A0A069PU94_9BURK|nr:hypothetical protein BG61_11595 [Caballeronia glathei]CDY74179.1 exported protein [Caballeronia glathei]